MHLSTPFRVPRRGSSQFCRIEIAPRRFSLPLCRITTGTRGAGGVVRVRTVIRESFHPLKSETLLRLLHRHQFLLHGPTISRLHVYAKYVCLSLRQQATKHRTSCNHIMLLERAAANHRERERERKREGERKLEGWWWCLLLGPSLNRNAVCHGLKSPQMDPPGKGREPVAGCQRARRHIVACGRAEKREAGNSFSMTKPYIGGHATYSKFLATSD